MTSAARELGVSWRTLVRAARQRVREELGPRMSGAWLAQHEREGGKQAPPS